MQLLYVARKYMVKSLERRCIDYLRSELNAENAIMLLNQRALIDDEDLINECWKVIDEECDAFMKTEDFKDIDHQTLDNMLSRDSLQSKEVSIFKAIMEWAKNACARESLPINAENQRQMLGDAFYKIRFTTMTEAEFAVTAAQSGVLSLEERLNLFLHFNGINQDLPFMPTPRCNHCIIYNASVKCDDGNHKNDVYFTTDRAISVVGFALYGSCNEACQCRVTIKLCDVYSSVFGGARLHARCIGEHTTTFESDGSPNVYPVFFTSPISVDADQQYRACVELDGPKQRYGGKEILSSVKCGDTTLKLSHHDARIVAMDITPNGYNPISKILFTI